MREVLGNHCRESQETRLEFGPRFSRGLSLANDLDVDAHRDNGKRYVVRADETLTAFIELERAVCIHLLSEQC